MTYELILGDRAYSSWSLRAWLLKEVWDLPLPTRYVSFLTESVAEQLQDVGTAKTVPTLVTPDGAILGESLAIAEELASRFPDADLWPADPKARAVARTLTSEMHAGFGPLRDACPMNLQVSYQSYEPDAAVLADLARLDVIWGHARDLFGDTGPWLCGSYSIADAFYAPVAARIAGYNLPVSETSQAYVDAHLAHGPFRRWRAMSLVSGPDLPWYARDYDQRPWPGPKPRAAKAADAGQSVNNRCPYSGEPVTDFLELDGTIYGFCNAFCRDKTIADPQAWPKFMALLSR